MIDRPVRSMSKNKLTTYFKNQLISFRKKFSNAYEKHDKKNIHRMRLSIKKLRAILSLGEIVCKGEFSKKEHITLFSKLFKKAGKVREVQMNLYLVEKHKSVKIPTLKKQLKDTLKKEIAALDKEMNQFDFKKLNRLDREFLAQIKRFADNLIIAKGMNYLHKKYTLINKLKDQLPGYHQKLHKIRIHLKAMLEITIVIGKLKPSHEIKNQQIIMKSLNNQIGEWHDYLIFGNSLTSVNQKSLTREENKNLVKLIKHNEHKEKSLRKNIREQLKLQLNRPFEFLTPEVIYDEEKRL